MASTSKGKEKMIESGSKRRALKKSGKSVVSRNRNELPSGFNTKWTSNKLEELETKEMFATRFVEATKRVRIVEGLRCHHAEHGVSSFC